jgi:hypothetical protein
VWADEFYPEVCGTELSALAPEFVPTWPKLCQSIDGGQPDKSLRRSTRKKTGAKLIILVSDEKTVALHARHFIITPYMETVEEQKEKLRKEAGLQVKDAADRDTGRSDSSATGIESFLKERMPGSSLKYAFQRFRIAFHSKKKPGRKTMMACMVRATYNLFADLRPRIVTVHSQESCVAGSCS